MTPAPPMGEAPPGGGILAKIAYGIITVMHEYNATPKEARAVMRLVNDHYDREEARIKRLAQEKAKADKEHKRVLAQMRKPITVDRKAFSRL